MTTEPGSDDLFATIADVSEIDRRARRERLRSLLEDARLQATSPADDPGVDHPDPDRAPLASEPHPEFDPLPPHRP